jgi:hypothetical protein
MVNISSLKTSPKIFSSSVAIRRHSFLSQFLICMTLVILLIGFCPIVSSSPTSTNNHKNKINYESNGFTFDANDDQATSADDASLLSPTVQHSLSGSSPLWYIQPRTRANQFLFSHTNENPIIVPKWYGKYHHDDQTNDMNNNNDDDTDDYVPSAMFFNKRSTTGNYNGGYSNLKKRKQITKPPMEVMNEIVNSIYLKR